MTTGLKKASPYAKICTRNFVSSHESYSYYLYVMLFVIGARTFRPCILAIKNN